MLPTLTMSSKVYFHISAGRNSSQTPCDIEAAKNLAYKAHSQSLAMSKGLLLRFDTQEAAQGLEVILRWI